MKVSDVNVRKHTLRAFLLAISLTACAGLIWFASSLTSMKDLRTRLANDGHGLLFELNRQTTQAVQQPNVPAFRWYVDLSTGVASELSDNDVVAMGLRTPHASLHSLFKVREDLIVQSSTGATDIALETAMLPEISGDKINEFSLDRKDYSLRCTGGGENFRIEFPSSTASSPKSNPIELLMHAFVPQDSDRLVSFSSRGKPAVANIQLRNLNDPSSILAEWKRSEDCLPTASEEHIFTLSNDKAQVEKRSLRTGELLDATPFRTPAGTAPIGIHLDPVNDLIIGRDNSSGTKGMIIADFRQATQIAFIPEAYPLDYAPISKCILFQALERPYETRRVLSIESGKAIELEGIDKLSPRTLFLCPSEPRAVAVMRDGSIQIHSLPDGKLVSTISSMQNNKEAWVTLAVLSVAMWVVCLMVSGKRLAANESLDIVVALVVTWSTILVLHQRTGISFGLGAVLSSFSIGAAIAVAIVLCEWSLHNPAEGSMRLVRWSLTLGILLYILGMMFNDELLFDVCSLREGLLGSMAFVALCYATGRINDIRLRRKYREQFPVAKNQRQWSITQLLWCTALVAIALALLNFANTKDRVDWLWLVECLVIYSLLILNGSHCCTVWRFAFHRGKRRVTTGSFAILIATVGLMAFVTFHFLYNGFSPIPISGFDFYPWYSVGFLSMFAILIYRTLPSSPRLMRVFEDSSV